jgi:UDP-2,4-diacetamido-2,4,6-trideoxy-beta-L-altropyranose hydrolase
MKKTIYFRADANSKVGLGHFSRTFALATVLKEKFSCTFLMNSVNLSIQNQLKFSHFNLKIIDCENLEEEYEYIKKVVINAVAIVIDGYQFNESYFKSMSSIGIKVIYIDDLFRCNSHVDVIINHALGATKSDYLDCSSKLCLGGDYAILRPVFLELAKQDKFVTSGKNIFICFGGVDTYNLTLTTLQALNFKHEYKLNIVLASTFPHVISVKQYIQAIQPQVDIHESLSEIEIAQLMNVCDVAIAPTSSLSYEICATKMGFVGGYYIDNQKNIHDGLVKEGCIYSLGNLSKVTPERIRDAVVCLFNNQVLRKTMMKNQKKVINGCSDINLLNIFKEL